MKVLSDKLELSHKSFWKVKIVAAKLVGIMTYGVAAIIRLLKIIGLFC